MCAGVSYEDLKLSLTTRAVDTGVPGTTPRRAAQLVATLGCQQARTERDRLMRAVYAGCVCFLTAKINAVLSPIQAAGATLDVDRILPFTHHIFPK